MPIYEYICAACGHQLEKLQKVSDAPLIDCPNCQKQTLKKQMADAGFRLKGTGWYATDFKNKEKKSETKSSAKVESASKETASSSSTSSDTPSTPSTSTTKKESSDA